MGKEGVEMREEIGKLKEEINGLKQEIKKLEDSAGLEKDTYLANIE